MIVERDYDSEYDEYVVRIADTVDVRFGKYYLDCGQSGDQNYYINVNDDQNSYFDFDHYKPFKNQIEVVNYITDKIKKRALDILMDIEAHEKGAIMMNDDESLPMKDRQAILESYLVPGNIIKSNDLYVIVKVLPENEFNDKRLLAMNFNHPGDDTWEIFPLYPQVSFGDYAKYCINAVYAPDYNEANKGQILGVSMPSVIWNVEENNKLLVWERDIGGKKL